MKLTARLILIFAGIFMPLLSMAQYYGNYAFRKKLTLNTTNYISGSSDLTNFTVLLSITDDDLIRTGAVTDKVKSSTANDIAFTDATISQSSAPEYNYQLESYDATTGTLKVWVKIPTLKKAANNTVYFYFGSKNPPAHPTASDTWTSDYKAVFHFNESSVSTTSGAITNGVGSNNATLSSNTASLQDGKIGKAYSFTGSQNIVTSSAVVSSGNQTFTMSAWIKPTDISSTSVDQKILSNYTSSPSTGFKMGIYKNGTTKVESEFWWGGFGSGTRNISGGTDLSQDGWYFVQTVGEGNGNGANIKTYVNGVLDRSVGAGSDGTRGSVLYIGSGSPSEGSDLRYFKGIIDEVRVSDVAKTADWLKTEYNNQLYPGNTGSGISGSPFISTYGSLEVLSTPPSAPADANVTANTISESVTNGTVVGITASSTTYTDGTIIYSLTDDAGGRFAINSSTGVVTVADASLINYESAISHSITVLASDTYTSSSATFTIDVTNVVEPFLAPVDNNQGANTVAENSDNGTAVGITAFSENESTPVSYSLTDDAGGRFTINTITGVVTIANSTLINYEANPSHTITITATSGSETRSSTFNITITDVAESATTNIYGGYLYRKKLTLNTANYISGSSDLTNFPVLLEIHDTDLAHTGVSSDKVKSAIADDIAFTDASVTQSTATEYNYQIESYDASSGVLKVWVKIPSLTKSANNQIYMYFGSSSPAAHPAASGTWDSDYKAVFHFNESAYSTSASAITDGAGSNNATLTSSANNLTTGYIGNAYSFNGTDQVITTVNQLPSTTSFTVSAWVKLAAIGKDQKLFSNQDASGKGYKMGIYTTDKAESEFNSDGRPFNNRETSGGTTFSTSNWYFVQTVFEGSTIKTYVNGALDRSGFGVIGTVGGNLYIGAAGLGEVNGNRFYFTGLIDEVRVSSVAKSADWISTEYNIQRYPSNIGTGLSGGSTFISSYGSLETVNTAPSAPSDINSVTNTIAEDAANGTIVGITVSAVDPEQNSVTYSLTDNAGGRFSINSSTGVVTVANGALLNYEVAQSHTITVQASDGYYTSSQTFTIAVSNVVELLSSITDVNNSADEVLESTAVGTVVPITAFAEHELNATVIYSLTNSANGKFTINSSTGVVNVAEASLDYETATSHTITVQAYDGTTTITQDFTIAVADYYDGFNSGYAFKKTLTLNNNLLPISSTLSNFPALLKIQDDNLILSSSCARIINSTSNPDLAFIDLSNPSSELNFQVQSYDSATGTVYVYVKVPSIETSFNNTIYAYFGTDVADAKHTQDFQNATFSSVPATPGSDWAAASSTIHANSAYASNGILDVNFEKAETLSGALTYTWTGALNTDPTNSANWDCTTSGTSNLLPANTGKATLIIPSGLSRYPVLTAGLSAYGLTIASGASLSLNGQQLNVKCNFYNNGSLLYNTNNASTLNFNGTLSNQYYYGNSTSGEVGKLDINNASGNVSLSGGGLDVYNLVTVSSNTLNSNGLLTLKASSTSSAAVAALPDNASIAGDVNVEVYFNGGSSVMRGTRSFASPVNENLSALNTYQQLQKYMIITGPNGKLNGFDPGGGLRPNAATLTRYWEPAKVTQSQFVDVSSITESLPPGNGVFIYYRGNRNGYTEETASTSNKVNAPFMDPESTAVKLQGPINQGDLKVNLTYTDNSGEATRNGFNLIGNPYPAVIDWEAVEKAGIGSQIVIAKPTGGFATYASGVKANADGMNPRYIQPGLAFYARATGNNSYVTFKENNKVVPTETPTKLLAARQNDMLVAIAGADNPTTNAAYSPKTLRINLEGKTDVEEAVVLFGPNFQAKASFDEDGIVFGSTTLAFGTLSSDNVRLTINALPTLATTTIIPLNVNAENTEDVKLNFTDLSALGNTQMVLVDNYLNKTVDVTSANLSYPFTIDKSITASYGSGRLRLVINPATVLPLESGSFVAKKQSQGVSLTWTTLSENGAREFLVEKSLNGLDFTELGRVKVAGNSSIKKQYSLADKTPADGSNYYKLTLLNDNNETAYTALTYINFSLKNNAIVSVYPNPASNVLNVSIDKSYKATGLNIISPEGKIVKQKQVEINDLLQLNISDLKPGVYILNLEGESNEVIATLKFIKN